MEECWVFGVGWGEGTIELVEDTGRDECLGVVRLSVGEGKCRWYTGVGIWTKRRRIFPSDCIWKLREHGRGIREN